MNFQLTILKHFLKRIRDCNKIYENFRQCMKEEFSIRERDVAIGIISKGNSPGFDGLTVEFYCYIMPF